MSVLQTLGFLRGWMGGGSVEVTESECTGPGGRRVPLTTMAPRGTRPLPAWIALHGITVPGRDHPGLVQFARAVAASGAVVVIPEVPEWRELELDTSGAPRVVAAALDAIAADPRTTGRPGLIGFSFGGPQALRIAADDELGPRLSGVASFGGFADTEAGLRYQMTGRIQTDEGAFELRPDPYARWIFAANYLPFVEGGDAYQPVADALHALAYEAGKERTPSWNPAYDPLKAELQAGLPDPELRELFRFFAPPAAEDPAPDHPDIESWVQRLAEAALRVAPEIEVPPGLVLHTPSHIVHGRSDPLFPFTEARALAGRIASPRPTHSVTGIFAHAGLEGGAGLRTVVEWARLTKAIHQTLRLTSD